jgi:hypothetical protein
MADFATNPYLQMPTQEAPDWKQVLGNALLGVGAGISQADGSGRGWAAGIGPGLMYGNQLMGQQRQNAEQQAMKRWQLGMMAQEYEDKRRERALKERQYQDAANEFAPGLRAPQSTGQMGPSSYETKVAGLEGGSKNGGMIFNELGSGAFGPYQFMPATWADVASKNPNLGLPADMTKATREQHDAAHGAFKAGNAQALQAAGFQPTPDNLYLAHRFGVGGAVNLLRSDPSKPLAEVLPIDWQRQNPDMRGQTVGGFRRLAAERMGGVGVPYEVQPDAKPTQYALQPTALPSFDDPTLSLSPRPSSRFMPGVLPNSDQAPSVTAPVMPQPQGPQGVVPAQFTPPQSATPAVPASDGPPKLVLPPKPELPAEEAVRLRNALMKRTMTPEQARAEKNRIENDLWGAHKDQAKAQHAAELEAWKQRQEGGRFERGKTAEQERHARDLAERKEAREVPSGYRKRDDGVLEPTPGGPADPIVQRREKVPTGYRNTPDGGLEPIPGGPADPARKPDVTPEEMKKLRTARTEAATIVTALEDFKSSFKKAGTLESVKSVAGMTTPVNTAYNTAALLAKGEELFNLGVLNGPDLDIIRRTLPDPSTMRGASTSVENMEAAVDKVIDLIQTRVAAREGQLGLPVTNVRELANTLKANAPGAEPPKTTAKQAPSPGFTKDGYRFKGGDPSQRMNWEPVK